MIFLLQLYVLQRLASKKIVTQICKNPCFLGENRTLTFPAGAVL